IDLSYYFFTFYCFFLHSYAHHRDLHSFPTRRSSDLPRQVDAGRAADRRVAERDPVGVDQRLPERLGRGDVRRRGAFADRDPDARSEEHTSELQSRSDLVCRLLLEKKKKNK